MQVGWRVPAKRLCLRTSTKDPAPPAKNDVRRPLLEGFLYTPNVLCTSMLKTGMSMVLDSRFLEPVSMILKDSRSK